MKSLTLVLAAVVMAATLLSGSVKVNLHHTHTLDGIEPYQITCRGTILKTCDVFLTTKIGDQGSYLSLFTLFQTAKEGDQIRLHMNGYGGKVDTTVQFINEMKSSKALVTTIVEGPVYSAHAFISIAGTHVVIRPGAMFLFHDTSALGNTCDDQKGHKDRGTDAYPKCLEDIQMHILTFEAFLKSTLGSLLTDKEYKHMFAGGQIYITGPEMQKRLEHK